MKRFFHNELEQFRSNLLLMGERAVEIVRLAKRAVLDGDIDCANGVVKGDDAIDELELVLDAEAIRYISMRAPVARDLRLLTVGMKAAHNLERVGDESTSIARRVIKLDAGLPVRNHLALPQMFDLTLEMLRDAINSFIDGDVEKAASLPLRDKDVDLLNRQNYDRLAEEITRNPAQVTCYLDLLFISKSVERIADHASNIAEEVVYLYRGEDVRHSQIVKDAKAIQRTGTAGNE